jgi:hypothetical protein
VGADDGRPQAGGDLLGQLLVGVPADLHGHLGDLDAGQPPVAGQDVRRGRTGHRPYLQWTRKVDGKTVTKLFTADQRDRYQDWFDNDRKLKDLVSQLETLSLTALAETEGWNHQESSET